MIDYLKKFEKTLVVTLVILMSLVLLLTTIDLGGVIVKNILTPPVGLLEIAELKDILGLFLMVLVGLELLEIIKIYFKTKLSRQRFWY